MSSWDASRGCYVVRIVYDGPGLAGKTTNVAQITKLFSPQKRSELYTPAQLKGRTMFFDWLEVEGPKASESQVRFQLITVPGQVERNYRRRPLVEMADVVIFVFDGSPGQLDETRRTFARLRASIKRRVAALPLVIQANKQDQPDALGPDKIRKKLKIAADVPIVPATAVQGRGVRETLATAMRLGLKTLTASEVVPLAAVFANADALFEHVLTFEDRADDNQPVDVEELNLGVQEVAIDAQAVLGHLAARSLDSLESRAREAALRETDDIEHTVKRRASAAKKRREHGSS